MHVKAFPAERAFELRDGFDWFERMKGDNHNHGKSTIFLLFYVPQKTFVSYLCHIWIKRDQKI
jgi:hypothetical protein